MTPMTDDTLTRTDAETGLAATMAEIGRRAREAAAMLALAPAEAQGERRCGRLAPRCARQADEILAANAEDVAEATGAGIGAALIDRLALDPKRLEGMARGLEDIAALPDPIGRVLGRLDPAQRAAHLAGQRAARGHRHHL